MIALKKKEAVLMEMKERKIGLKQNTIKLTVNEYGDFILLNGNDTGLFDKFTEFIAWLEKKGAEVDKKQAALSERFKNTNDQEELDIQAFAEYNTLQKDMCKETAERIDRIFGQDVMHKYFRPFYEVNPDFIPDEECIMDFMDEMNPVLNDLFTDRKKRIDLKYSQSRKGGSATRYRK